MKIIYTIVLIVVSIKCKINSLKGDAIQEALLGFLTRFLGGRTMKITLAEALPLRAAIMRRISELIAERNEVSTITYVPGEVGNIEYPARKVDEITAEIEEARADFRKLDILMAKANVTETLEWEGQSYTIVEAIEIAKQMRSEVAELKRLAGRRKEEIQRGFGGTVTITRTLYEPEEMRKKAIELEKRANRLSQLIDKKNYQVEIDFPEAEKYLG
jgi:hypothetical protein